MNETKSSQNVLISVVMPCLNEEKTLPICIRKAWEGIKRTGLPGEVIVADNGSTDNSVQVAKELGARVVYQSVKGYGSALMKGIEESIGRYIVMADADDSYDFLDIPRFIEPLRSGACDLVMGSRFKGKIMPGAMRWHHKWIGNPVLTSILRLMYGVPISDAHCGMRSFSREAYNRMHLCMPGMEFASEMLIKAGKARLRVTEIPITLHKDKRGRPPHLKSFRDGWRHLKFMLMYSPTYLFLVPGSVFGAVGTLLQLLLLWGPVTIGGRRFDYHVSLVAAMVTLLGVQVISHGILAKAYMYTEKFDDFDPFIKWFFRVFTVERGLIVGLALFLSGLVIFGSVVYEWIASGYGELQAVARLSFSASVTVAGLQVIFSSFSLGCMALSDRRGPQ